MDIDRKTYAGIENNVNGYSILGKWVSAWNL